MYALLADSGFGMRHDFGDGRGHPFLMLLCLIAIGAAIGLAVVLIGRRRPVVAAGHIASPAPLVSSTTSAAEAILAERLARSEITPDDYRSMLAALREPGPLS